MQTDQGEHEINVMPKAGAHSTSGIQEAMNSRDALRNATGEVGRYSHGETRKVTAKLTEDASLI
jgi:hypothetical protein